MEARLALVIGVVADQVLAADLLADALYGFFEAPLLDEVNSSPPVPFAKTSAGLSTKSRLVSV